MNSRRPSMHNLITHQTPAAPGQGRVLPMGAWAGTL
ncbi:MAG: hypothetical protein ACI8QS_002149, partial [Planctomycetota bacterium]